MTPLRTRFLRRGDRIELLRCESHGPTPRPRPGDRGTVQSVSANEDVRVDWDSGIRACVNPDAGDRIKLLETPPRRGS